MNRISGRIEVAADKSVSHRALMISSIARGKTLVKNFLRSDDCLSTMAAMRALGVSIDDRGTEVLIDGRGTALTPPAGDIYAGNSGTTARLLAGILAGQNFKTIITGDASLSSRPMGRIERPLNAMGAAVKTTGGKLPVEIKGGKLRAAEYSSDIASAQVKSCVLLAGLYANGLTTFREPRKSRDHTERMLTDFGVDIRTSDGGAAGCSVTVKGPSGLASPETIEVPGDISSAAFFMTAASILPGSNITITGVGVNPTRTGVIDVLRRMGADITVDNPRNAGGEPVADITVKYAGLRGVDIAEAEIPLLIDELPIIAVAACLADGPTTVTGAAELRVKETDRIKSVVGELSKMGARINELPDGFRVEGPSRLRGARVDSRGDHRMAMSLAVASLAAEGETIVTGPECAAVSFPNFYETLARVKS